MISLSIVTSLFTFLSAASGATLLVLVYLDNRKSRIDDGIARFQRHIDALSTESRRSSVNRNKLDDTWGR